MTASKASARTSFSGESHRIRMYTAHPATVPRNHRASRTRRDGKRQTSPKLTPTPKSAAVKTKGTDNALKAA
jgi:hypothetical protein